MAVYNFPHNLYFIYLINIIIFDNNTCNVYFVLGKYFMQKSSYNEWKYCTFTSVT